jgi:hypothetical protein
MAPSRTVAQTSNSTESAQGDRDKTLQQLLTEVRELRLAVQRATVNNTRFQMLIERMRIEQARVDAIGRQLENHPRTDCGYASISSADGATNQGYRDVAGPHI